jgi:hypothetical protein
MLMPGMRGTPEAAVLSRSSLPPAVKEAMRQQVGGLTYKRLIETEDFSVLKWFHYNGVPQVVPLTGDVIRKPQTVVCR